MSGGYAEDLEMLAEIQWSTVRAAWHAAMPVAPE
jgi:hypothetical protein